MTNVTELVATRPGPLGYVPLWASVLLSRVQGGKTIDEARYLPGSKVSRDTVAAYSARNPDWHTLLMEAQEGAVTGVPVAPIDIARARANSVADHMADLAEGAKWERDQITAGRLVLEVAGAVGSSSQGAVPATAIQINIVVQGKGEAERKGA